MISMKFQTLFIPLLLIISCSKHGTSQKKMENYRKSLSKNDSVNIVLKKYQLPANDKMFLHSFPKLLKKPFFYL